MALGDNPPAIRNDDGDPADLIVGTVRLPPWLIRVPRPAWVFVLLAVLDGASRIARGLPLPDAPLMALLNLVPGVVSGVAIILLPAAVLLAGRAPRRLDARLLQGTIALAAGELVRQLGPSVVRAVIGFQNADMDSLLAQSLAVQLPAILLTGFGLLRIGLSLLLVAGPERPLRRLIFTIGSATIALTLVASWSTFAAAPADAGTDLLVPYNVLISAANIGIIALTAWLASIAIRRGDRSWRLVATGSLVVVVADAISSLGWLLGLTQYFVPDPDPIVTWSAIAAATVGAVGWVAVALGFAFGLQRESEGS